MYLDLTEWATRPALFDEVVRLEDGLADGIRAQADEAGVGNFHHHDLGEVLQTIDNLAGVSDEVRQDMRAIYQILAEAEAKVHGCEVDHTHFHEVGEGSHIKSVLEICLAIRSIAPERITASKVQVGSGQIECSHGLMDVPAPATAAILERGIPIFEPRLEGERCTPTSAAVIFHFVDEFVE